MSTVTDRVPLIDLPLGAPRRHLGCMQLSTDAGKKLLPLAGVDIQAKVADRVASVTVTQKFRNTFAEHLQAVYIFPLSGGCVVSAFEMRVGDRVVKAAVKERGEARANYQQALQEGKRAALLEQERHDVFTMQVGNLPAGQEVTVVLTYSERLSYFDDGRTELRLPLVVGPRYVPGDPVKNNSVGGGTVPDTDRVPDASRITPPLLAPGFDAKVELNISVELLSAMEPGGVSLADLECSQHATSCSIADGGMKIELARDDERLNRDFVLQWRLAGSAVKSNLLVFHGDDGDYAILSIIPPKREGYLGAARDVLFLVDRSGSMMGMKMVSAVRACLTLINTLGPRDRFAIGAFDNCVEWMPDPGSNGFFVEADEDGLQRGDQFLRKIQARGGTEMNSALAASLAKIASRSNPEGRIPVLVVLTDGQVGDESRILKRVQNELNAARLFAVGIDTAVNSGLLKKMASLGGGTATFVQPGTALEEALQAVGREIGKPLVIDLKIEGTGGAKIDEITPTRIPDLFAGRATTCFFKLSGKGTLSIKGKFADGQDFNEQIKPKKAQVAAIPQLWARSIVSDLEDSYRVCERDTTRQAAGLKLKQQIIEVSVKHSVLTRFTAFVAVDHAEVVNTDGTLRTIVQPVEAPAGWQMLDAAAPAAAPMLSRARMSSAQSAVPQDWGAPAPSSAARNGPASDSFMASEPEAGWGCASAPSPAPPSGQPQSSFFDSVTAAGMGVVQNLKALMPNHSAGGADPSWTGGGAPNAPMPAQGELFSNAQIAKQLELFAQELKGAADALKAGTLPSATALRAAWERLIFVLTMTVVGTEVPALQKFLRCEAVELIDSLAQPGVSAASLLPLWESHLKVFPEAQAEATNQLASKSTGGGGNFWEKSV